MLIMSSLFKMPYHCPSSVVLGPVRARLHAPHKQAPTGGRAPPWSNGLLLHEGEVQKIRSRTHVRGGLCYGINHNDILQAIALSQGPSRAPLSSSAPVGKALAKVEFDCPGICY